MITVLFIWWHNEEEWINSRAKGNRIPAHHVHLYARFLSTNLATVFADPVCSEWAAGVQQSRAGQGRAPSVTYSSTAVGWRTDCPVEDADECFCCRAPRLCFFQLSLRKQCKLGWLRLYSNNNVGRFSYEGIQCEVFSRNYSKCLGYVNRIASSQPPPHFPAQPPSLALSGSLTSASSHHHALPIQRRTASWRRDLWLE